MSCRIRLSILLAVVISVLSPLRAEIRNGPYLQQVTTNSVLVCWTTTKPQPGLVRFGPSGKLTRAVPSPRGLFHRVRLRGLAPGRRCSYQV